MIAPKKAPSLDPATLADRELDRRISDGAEKIRGALVGYERAIGEQRKCQKSAVLSAWSVGGLLIEKKARLDHGCFGPWLLTIGISTSSAADYMKIAAHISDAGNLKSSISQTLKMLAPPPAAPRPTGQPPAAPRPAGPPPAAPCPAAARPAEKLPARQPPAAPRPTGQPPAAPRPAGPPPAAPCPAAARPAEKLPARQPPAAPRDRIGELEARILVLEDELKEERARAEELRRRILELEATGDAAA